MKCDNTKRGCEWEGTVGTLEEHVNTCDFTPIPCPKECKQNDAIQMILMKDLEKHLTKQCVNRNYKCQTCGKKDTFTNITGIHDDKCEKKVLPCPNADCTDSMQRAEIKQHLENDCEHTVISCKYEKIGCDVKMKRKDMGAHEQDDKAHLHQALNTVVELQSATQTIASIQKKSVVFRVMKRKKFFSTSFYTGINGYNMRIKVHPEGSGRDNGTHVSVFVHILEGDNDDNLKWPFIGSAKIELLNQLEDENHHFMTVIFNQEKDAHVGSNQGYPKFIRHSKLPHDPVNNTQYLKDDTLYFRASVEVSGHKPWLECTLK